MQATHSFVRGMQQGNACSRGACVGKWKVGGGEAEAMALTALARRTRDWHGGRVVVFPLNSLSHHTLCIPNFPCHSDHRSWGVCQR